MECAICKRNIDQSNQIISRKDQPDELNYYFFDKLSPGASLIERLDIKMEFTVDDEPKRLCRVCFSNMMAAMVLGIKQGGFNWLDQWNKAA